VDVVLGRLADAMLVQALRVALSEGAGLAGSPGAVRDPRVASAGRAVHEHPDRCWTVAQVAAEAGYSRAAFASRFRRLVGEPPMACVKRIRLGRAAALPEETSASLAEVPRQAAYANEFSFNRSFKRAFGLPPAHIGLDRSPHPIRSPPSRSVSHARRVNGARSGVRREGRAPADRRSR
jgi:transcriptional regulator GlxA family with amidase domain